MNQRAKKTINTLKSSYRYELFIAVDMQNTVITCQLITIKPQSPPQQCFVHKQFVLQTTELNKLIPCFQQNENVNIIITNNTLITNKAKINPQDFKYFTSSSFSSDSDVLYKMLRNYTVSTVGRRATQCEKDGGLGV